MPAAAPVQDHDGPRSAPIVIGHRGAAGHRPGHTLAGYQFAIDVGADYIEPDLVSTSDGELVARHENEISQTTDVADHPEFADRRTTKTIDRAELTGWFTEDFTLAELKTLRARERLPALRPDNTVFDGLCAIPTLLEIIELARAGGIGIYPETKHPTHFASLGLALEEPLVEALHASGYRDRGAPVFIQSFEVGSLRRLERLTQLPLIQLLGDAGAPFDLVAAGSDTTYDDMVTVGGLRQIARYADGIGPARSRIVPLDAEGCLDRPTSLVEDAHDAGLLVHAYTFRNENAFLPVDLRRGDPDAPTYRTTAGAAPEEYALYFDLGVDGVFSDHPDTAVATRHAWCRADRGATGTPSGRAVVLRAGEP